MRRLLLGLCCLIGFVSFADALTKHEVLHLIHHIGNEFNNQRKIQIIAVLEETVNQIISGEQRTCVSGYIPNMFNGFNSDIGMEISGMRDEYERKKTSELITLTEEQLKKTILSRLEAAVNWLPDRLKQIRKCAEK